MRNGWGVVWFFGFCFVLVLVPRQNLPFTPAWPLPQHCLVSQPGESDSSPPAGSALCSETRPGSLAPDAGSASLPGSRPVPTLSSQHVSFCPRGLLSVVSGMVSLLPPKSATPSVVFPSTCARLIALLFLSLQITVTPPCMSPFRISALACPSKLEGAVSTAPASSGCVPCDLYCMLTKVP